ncbi:MAG TPA: hypothetical protein V6C65_40820 [Allocoleopsis sp.]
MRRVRETFGDTPKVYSYADRPKVLTYQGINFELRENASHLYYTTTFMDVCYIILKPHGGWWWTIIAIDQKAADRCKPLNCRRPGETDPLYEHHSQATEPDAPHWCKKLAEWLTEGNRPWQESFDLITTQLLNREV